MVWKNHGAKIRKKKQTDKTAYGVTFPLWASVYSVKYCQSKIGEKASDILSNYDNRRFQRLLRKEALVKCQTLCV